MYVEQKEEEEKTEEELPQLYPMHNGIVISGERIDLQRSTKVLLKRLAIKQLRQNLAE